MTIFAFTHAHNHVCATMLVNGFVDDALRNMVPSVNALAHQCRISVSE